METFISVLHIIVALLLIALVLLQDSKSGSVGGAFGGSTSNSVFGATGAATLAQKITRGAAFIFALTSITLSVYSSQQHKSIMDSAVTAPAATSAPAQATPPPVPTNTAAPSEAPKK